jgi:superfamily I DNA and/or RNA helicase
MMAMGRERWSRLLDVQYRMHERIMSFSSEQLYEGRLRADAAVAKHVLADLPHVTADDATSEPLQLIDTAGAEFDEASPPGGESRFNEREAKLVVRKVRSLLAVGLRPTEVAVITPYAAQVRLIAELLADLPEVEVDSVDGFQGREKEAIVVSLVRSNADGEIGFLADVRRMNVALTRARRRLVVIGDGALLGGHPFYKALLDYFEQQAGYRSVWEEPLD